MLDTKVEKRILAALNFEEAYRVPIWDYLDNRGIVDHICPGWTDIGVAMVQVYHTLGIDLCRGYGAVYSESDDGWTEYVDGALQRTVSGRTHWQITHPIQSLEDLKSFTTEPFDEQWARTAWIDHNRAQMAKFEPYTLFVPGASCGFHDTYGLMGQQLFSYAIYDDPISIERILEVKTESSYRLAKAAAEAKLGPVFFIADDVAYKGATLFSPDFLRRTFIKSLRKCIEPLKAAGIKVIFHSDGYLMEILDDMIDAGIDGLNPVEPLAGMDIALLKKRYGKNLVLVGNVDCSQTLPLGSVQDVIRATKQCLRDASPGGGHFIGSSSEIVPSTPVANILAFYETCRTWGAYPLQV